MLKTTLHMLRCKGFGLKFLAQFMHGPRMGGASAMHFFETYRKQGFWGASIFGEGVVCEAVRSK